MLKDKYGKPITKERLKQIRRRLGIKSAREIGEPCRADRHIEENFLFYGNCSYCGLPRRVHVKRTSTRA